MATTLIEVLRFINHDMTSEEREAIVLAVNAAQRRLEQRAMRDLYEGITVEWDGKLGHRTGTVQKVNRRSVHVKDSVSGVMWRVSPNLLKVVPR